MSSLGFLFLSLCGFLLPLAPVHGLTAAGTHDPGPAYETFSLLPFPEQLKSQSPFRDLHVRVVEQTHDPPEWGTIQSESACQYRPFGFEDPALLRSEIRRLSALAPLPEYDLLDKQAGKTLCTQLTIRPSDQVFVVWVFGHTEHFFERVLGLSNIGFSATKMSNPVTRPSLEAFVLPLEELHDVDGLHYSKILFLTVSPGFSPLPGIRRRHRFAVSESRAQRAYISFALRMSHVAIFHYDPSENSIGEQWEYGFANSSCLGGLRRRPSGPPRFLCSDCVAGGGTKLPPIEVKVRYSTVEAAQPLPADKTWLRLPPPEWRPQVSHLAYAANKDLYDSLTERGVAVRRPPLGLSVPPAAILKDGALRGVRLVSNGSSVFRTRETESPEDRRQTFFRTVVLRRERADNLEEQSPSDFSKVNPADEEGEGPNTAKHSVNSYNKESRHV